MNGRLLLTFVDHAKPFKGTWQIFQDGETRYSACHSPSTAPSAPEPPSCQVFTTNQQVCRFAELLQHYGWCIEAETPESARFRQACAL